MVLGVYFYFSGFIDSGRLLVFGFKSKLVCLLFKLK